MEAENLSPLLLALLQSLGAVMGPSAAGGVHTDQEQHSVKYMACSGSGCE